MDDTTSGAEETTINRRDFLDRSLKLAAGAGVISQVPWLPAEAAPARGASSADWQNLRKLLGGRLLMQGEPGYGKSAQPYNRLYSTIRPKGIAMCTNASDARAALLWAQQTGEAFTVMSGAHSYAGYSTCRGLIIDVAHLHQVRFDRATGKVHVGPGTRNQQVFDAMPVHHVSLPHGRCPNTALGGFVLGGGFGFTSRSQGLLCDTLVSTEIITAAGEILTCDARQHADLFWACRGGTGGNFGVNTAYTLQTQPWPARCSVYRLEWPWSQAAAAVTALQSMMLHAPNELGCRIGLGATGLQQKHFEVNSLGEYRGSAAQLRELLQPVITATRPSKVTIKDVTHAAAIRFLAADTPFGRFTAKSSYTAGALSDAAIAALIHAIEQVPGSTNPDGSGVAIFCLGGAVNRVPAHATAYVHRNARFLMCFESTWKVSDAPHVVAATQHWPQLAYNALQRHVLPQSYQNWPDRGLKNWHQVYFGSNFARLTRVKARYDPENVFRYPQSVPLHP